MAQLSERSTKRTRGKVLFRSCASSSCLTTPLWPETFKQIKDAVWPVVERWALALEHVGSTSVPGLAAKPVIDVDVVVQTQEESEGAIRALEGLGYTHVGNLGLVGREAMRAPAAAPRQNLYVCLKGSEPYVNHLLVRDYLRTHPNAARAYGNLKLQLADRFEDDIEGYIDGKTDFLIGVLRESGFPEAALRRAEAINRKPPAP